MIQVNWYMKIGKLVLSGHQTQLRMLRKRGISGQENWGMDFVGFVLENERRTVHMCTTGVVDVQKLILLLAR